ncbi:MAG: hypothetical protein RL115_2238 [Bacteroidota bacterium]|jgi:hypothetical protein
MQINYTTDAFSSLLQLVNFIESKNTIGAGSRWLTKYETYLQEHLIIPHLVKYCHNKTFQKFGLRCLNYKDWLIAFSIQGENVLIEALLHQSRIVD